MRPHIHHVPGRLRVRVARVRRNPELAEAVRRAMERVEGVQSAEANPLTGSVVLHYNPASTSAGALLSALRESGYPPELTRPEARSLFRSGPPSQRVARKAAEAVAWKVMETAVERAVPMLIAALL